LDGSDTVALKLMGMSTDGLGGVAFKVNGVCATVTMAGLVVSCKGDELPVGVKVAVMVCEPALAKV